MEIITQSGADLCITSNIDGSYTAAVNGISKSFLTLTAAVEWACCVRDGERHERA